jgi:hypothetical protein
VRGDASAASLQGHPIAREIAASQVDRWFPEGEREGAGILSAICRGLDGTSPGSERREPEWLRIALRRALKDGRITAVRARLGPPVGEIEEEEKPVVRERAALASISYQVVDDATGEPVPDLALLITLPDGNEQERRTDKEGTIRFDGIRPGRCSVRGDRRDRDLLHVLVYSGMGLQPVGHHAHGESEAWERPTIQKLKKKLVRTPRGKATGITAVLRHRVRTGDTLASIAKRYELEADALTKFNFGTTDPDEVQRLLVREVGSRHRNLATGEVVLSDQDRPGIVYVPQPFRAEGQMTDNDYVIRVHQVQPAPRPYVFSL